MLAKSWAKYEMVEAIGAGSYGQVYLVEGRKAEGGQPGTHVVKRVHVADMADNELRGAINEVQVLSLLDHCNVVAYRDHYVDDEGHLNIVMEYCAQGDLAKLIDARKQAKHPLKQDEIAYWGFQLLQAVKYVHGIGIIHRDVKPANVFLTANSILKLADFGISKLVSATTAAKTVIGTMFYIAPEICESKPYTSQADVWSCGCVLYELAALEKAFHGANMLAVVKKVTDGEYRPLPKRYSTLSKMISRMIRVDPDARATISEVIEAFYLCAGAALPAPPVDGSSDIQQQYAEWWRACQSKKDAKERDRPSPRPKKQQTPPDASGGHKASASKREPRQLCDEFPANDPRELSTSRRANPSTSTRTKCCRIPDLLRFGATMSTAGSSFGSAGGDCPDPLDLDDSELDPASSAARPVGRPGGRRPRQPPDTRPRHPRRGQKARGSNELDDGFSPRTDPEPPGSAGHTHGSQGKVQTGAGKARRVRREKDKDKAKKEAQPRTQAPPSGEARGGGGRGSSPSSSDGGYSMDDFEDPDEERHRYSDESFEQYEGTAGEESDSPTPAKPSSAEWAAIRAAIEIDHDTDRQATIVRGRCAQGQHSGA
eukprot:TRINITY_DN22009_c0_g1_i1.p1 TRINITY_DN22009_c0_g1~~TRINITY_DN22009_c0_g1_i1.p1  ORF type:complete len:599 (+),score=192.02 TRINITY_DN22009_c0_g1_i1:186-1982(+)